MSHKGKSKPTFCRNLTTWMKLLLNAYLYVNSRHVAKDISKHHKNPEEQGGSEWPAQVAKEECGEVSNSGVWGHCSSGPVWSCRKCSNEPLFLLSAKGVLFSAHFLLTQLTPMIRSLPHISCQTQVWQMLGILSHPTTGWQTSCTPSTTDSLLPE